MKRKILVVEDDLLFLDAISELLESSGYEVTKISSVERIVEILKKEQCDLLLCDVVLGVDSGFSILNMISQSDVQVPIIFMSGYENIEGVEKALSHEKVIDLLVKPFHIDDLEKLLIRTFSEEGFQNVESRTFLKVPFSAIAPNVILDFDIYVRLRSEKFVKVLYRGHTIDDERFLSYKNKNLEGYYVHSGDLTKLLETGIRNFEVCGESISNEVINEKLHEGLGEALFHNMSFLGRDTEQLKLLYRYSQVSIAGLKSSPRLNDIFKSIMQTDELSRHSYAVMILSLYIGLQLKEINPSNLVDIGMGAFFHDIGKLKLPESVLEKSEVTMSYSDRKLYRMHPELGFEFLKSLNFPKEVQRIVIEHHERVDGKGYPYQLSGNQIHFDSKLVSICNEFIKLLTPFKSKVSLDEILKKMKSQIGDGLDSVLMRKFEYIISE
ncbi:MAG: response regulator [Bdellovibrionales bacterium]|nr:response regulator [Bdellovibrionales bacterium]